MDAAAAFRLIKQTTGCIKVIRFDGEKNNSPFENLQCLLYEGDDGYDQFVEHGAATLKELKELEKHGLHVEGIGHVRICVLEGKLQETADEEY